MRVFFFCLGALLIATAKGQTEEPAILKKISTDEVELTCTDGVWKLGGKEVDDGNSTIKLRYKDESSGEYECRKKSDDDLQATYHVKFRTCDSCIELDLGALVGIIVGNIVATILIGIAVYSISTQSKGPSFSSNKASQESDRRNLIQNDSTYQQLNNTGRDAYEVLHTRRR